MTRLEPFFLVLKGKSIKGGASPRFVRTKIAAFSLIEVVLAIGIISFCLLVILGVMVIAYHSNEDASDRTAEALILQSTRGVMGNLPYTNLLTQVGSPSGLWLGFTEEGQYLGSAGSAANLTNTATFYRVQIQQVKVVNFTSMQAIVHISKRPPAFSQTDSFPTAFTRYGPQY